MKILYAAGLSPNDSSLHRPWALERMWAMGTAAKSLLADTRAGVR